MFYYPNTTLRPFFLAIVCLDGDKIFPDASVKRYLDANMVYRIGTYVISSLLRYTHGNLAML